MCLETDEACCDVTSLFSLKKLAPDHVRDACISPRAPLLGLLLEQQKIPVFTRPKSNNFKANTFKAYSKFIFGINI